MYISIYIVLAIYYNKLFLQQTPISLLLSLPRYTCFVAIYLSSLLLLRLSRRFLVYSRTYGTFVKVSYFGPPSQVLLLFAYEGKFTTVPPDCYLATCDF